MTRARGWVLLLVAGCAACGDDDAAPAADAAPRDGGADPACVFRTADDDAVTDPASATPRWAFEPWISKDISDAEDTRAFLAGFRERDIPVGAVVIDSPWETQYNDFEPNPERYPGFAALVDELHAQDVRIVMWATQMVNRTSFDLETGGDTYVGPSPNFDEGLRCGFFVNDGDTYLWWKGSGAGVDFFDPEAVAWWRRQQDALLALGIDGYKLDFGD